MGVQTFRGVVSARDGDHRGSMVMSGWTVVVSDALIGFLATFGVDQSAGASDVSLVEVEQRIRVLTPVQVGESIEIESGIVAVEPHELTVAHRVLTRSAGRSSDVARAWSVAGPAAVDGGPSEFESRLIGLFERRCVAESKVFGG